MVTGKKEAADPKPTKEPCSEAAVKQGMSSTKAYKEGWEKSNLL